MKIRALTLYTELNEQSDLDNWLQEKIALLEKVSSLLESFTGLEVWTKRITVNPAKDETVRELLNKVKRYSDVKFMIYQRPISRLDVELLKEVTTAGAYSALIADDPGLMRKVVSALGLASDVDQASSTRFAIEMSGQSFETAYFPLALHQIRHNADRFALAVLYPEDAIRVKGDIMQALEEVLGTVHMKLRTFLKNGVLGNEVTGVDYSLSPWMDESVARFIQEKGGCRFEDLGCMEEIRKINMYLDEFSRAKRGIGFNEVMLPLGEDNELKALVEEGKMSIKDFLIYSTVCVAGIDMIPVVYNRDRLLRLLTASYSIARQKRRPFGVRLIAVKKPERKIYLEGFGEIPIAEYG